jgi:hypothetical protein
MGAEEGEVYILRPDDEAPEDDEESWVSPQPADEAILGAVAEEVDTDVDEFDDLEEYVDLDDLAALFGQADDESGPEDVTFEVDDHEVTVHRSGEIDVSTAES